MNIASVYPELDLAPHHICWFYLLPGLFLPCGLLSTITVFIVLLINTNGLLKLNTTPILTPLLLYHVMKTE